MPVPDFSKVWASNSPLPPYTFSDADYLTGWDFVGSAPPTKNEFDAWFSLVDEKLNWLYGQLQSTAAQIYPVGSVYMSFDPTDPTNLFGGSWVRLKDRMLMAAGDTYAINTTGGSATVTLNTNQLPAHTHSISTNGQHNHTATNSSAGVHNHTVSGSIANAGDHTHTWSGSTASAGGHTHTWSGSATSAGQHTHTWSGSATSAGDHTHTWSGSSASAGQHTHTASGSVSSAGDHTHTRGTMDITGKFTSDAQLYDASGAFNVTSNGRNRINASVAYIGNWINFKASDSWTGATSSAGSHTHSLSITIASNGSHTHTLSGTNTNNGSHTHTLSGTNANNGNHTHTLSGSNATNGNHTHTLSGTNTNNGTHTHAWIGSVANAGNHTHTITVANSGSHTHTIGNTGGGLPVNILPPYQTVYMWKRTA